MLEKYYKTIDQKKTERFHALVSEFREELETIWKEFEKKEQQLKGYNDSRRYKNEIRQYTQEREKKIDDLKANYNREFALLIGDMEKAINDRKMLYPTQEELALINSLKSLKSITRDEIEMARNTLVNPLMLKELQEIAKDRNIFGVEINRDMTSQEAREVVESLKDGKKRLLSMNRPRSRYIVGDGTATEEEKRKALYSFKIDTDTKTDTETMSLYGGVNFSELQKFNDIVG